MSPWSTAAPVNNMGELSKPKQKDKKNKNGSISCALYRPSPTSWYKTVTKSSQWVVLSYYTSCIAVFSCGWMQRRGLTHWGRVTHICVGNLTIIGSDNGLSPGRRQAIIWTNAGILLIRTLGTNFSEILGEIHSFSFSEMHLKMSSAKWRLFGLGLNVLRVGVAWCWVGSLVTRGWCGVGVDRWLLSQFHVSIFPVFHHQTPATCW